jgi:hypothetical protein
MDVSFDFRSAGLALGHSCMSCYRRLSAKTGPWHRTRKFKFMDENLNQTVELSCPSCDANEFEQNRLARE